MKISYLHIRNYKQFSDLELELTYPVGHDKAGQPLDKICIIGQSGTGKTNLLDIIKKSTVDFSEQANNNYLPFSEFVGKNKDDKYITTKFEIQKRYIAETLFSEVSSKITFKKKKNKTKKYKFLKHEKNYFVSTTKCKEENEKTSYEFDASKMSQADKILYEKLLNTKSSLVLESINEEKENPYLKMMYGLSYNDTTLSRKLTEGRKKSVSEKRRELQGEINKIENKYMSISDSIEKLKQNNFIDKSIIDINTDSQSWQRLKDQIDNYDNEKIEYMKQLSRKLLNDEKYTKEDFKKEMTAWEAENENLIEKIADDINSIIRKFNLELELNEYTQSYDELKIKDLSNGNIVAYDDLSTGTKNLLSTFIPLKSYKPQDSIILIDEPEMSFYPDIQRELVDLYTGIGTNNQLILATHSPLIASSFEPWEVVELKFDDNNQIYREKYYEGENHVDNYTVDPRMLTWTGILMDVFDLKEDSNFDFREQKLMEYATLKSKIKQMIDMEDKEKAFEKLKKVSKLLGIYGK